MSSPLRNFSLTSPDGTPKSADELQADANRLIADARARGERMAAKLAENSAEATSRNMAATVVVTATGALQSVRLSDRTKGMGPAMIAASVMEAYQAATRKAVARTTEIAAEEGADPRVAQMMLDMVPEHVDPEHEER
jgi:DNA-binding protein YbaB